MNNENNLINRLANNIYLQKKDNNRPILFLGAGCSISSGCPSSQQLIESLIKENGLNLDPENTTLSDIEERLHAPIFNLNLKNYFQNSNPNYGFWILAELIRKNFFDLILTTNYDTCVEKVLSKLMSVDKYRVMVRGDIDDSRIKDLIESKTPKVKIVKLHGDYISRNMLVSPNEIWQFDKKLEDYLKAKIYKKGIIFIGCSFDELQIIRNLPKASKLLNNSWYINPRELKEGKKNNIGFTQCITGANADFDFFIKKLGKKIIKKEQEDNQGLKKIKSDLNPNSIIFEKLITSLSPVVDINMLKRKIIELQESMARMFINKNNLVFIHDPDCPGGTEVMKLMEKLCDNWLETQCIYTLEIKGREEKIYDRKTGEMKNKDNGKITDIDITLPFILVDSVSFTGGTIEKCYEKLVNEFGENIKIFAAVIFTGLSQEKRLEKGTFCIKNEFYCRLETINNYHIQFPWGYTSSTKPVEAYNIIQQGTIEKLLPSHRFSFLPRQWGKINSLVENQIVSVKLLYLNPRERTSKHVHYFRDELFYILQEHMTLQLEDQHITLKKGDFLCVPAGIAHRHIAMDVPCWILEISFNYSDQIHDIYRYEDKYDRPAEDGSK